jgi:hypothetical protein
MKKIVLGIIVTFFGMLGSANGTSYTETTILNDWLWGAGTYSWIHNTPADFSVPADTVTSASLEIFAFFVNGNNDPVYVQSTFVGNLTNTSFDFSEWTLEGTKFDISDIFSPIWDANSFTVSLNYNEFSCWCPGILYLGGSKFTLDYENGTAPVPEPSTMLLLGAGLLGLVGYNRRRASKKA